MKNNNFDYEVSTLVRIWIAYYENGEVNDYRTRDILRCYNENRSLFTEPVENLIHVAGLRICFMMEN